MHIELSGLKLELAKGSYVRQGNRIIHKNLGVLNLEEARTPRSKGEMHKRKSRAAYTQAEHMQARAHKKYAEAHMHSCQAAVHCGEHELKAHELEKAKQKKMEA